MTAPHPFLTAASFAVLLGTVSAQETQLTHAPHGHVLTNVNVWSPDSRWLVYDVRSSDGTFDSDRIEQVNADTGEVQVLYRAPAGSACGVVTFHPREPKVVFIHAPEPIAADWTYGASRRRGAVVDVRQPGRARPLDAATYAPPFVPGALRGGTHVHVFSPDGAWVSSTYEDEVLARLGPAVAGADHDLNQRNVAVTVPWAGGVTVPRTHPRNHDGDGFSVVVTRTVNRPRPGSDEIAKAFEEGWVVGRDGGRALAFLGLVTAADGREHAEVFLAELPADLTQAGSAPIAGSEVRRPAPPVGVLQRRLTFTADRKYPGVALVPRHWLRANPAGDRLAFLMRDDAGVVQLWTIAPAGGVPRQLTRNAEGIASAFTWTPDGRAIAHVMAGSVCVTNADTGATRRLTRPDPATQPHACVVSPDGRRIAFLRPAAGPGGTFSQVWTVPIPVP